MTKLSLLFLSDSGRLRKKYEKNEKAADNPVHRFLLYISIYSAKSILSSAETADNRVPDAIQTPAYPVEIIIYVFGKASARAKRPLPHARPRTATPAGTADGRFCIRRRPRGITLRRAAVCGGLGVSYAAVCFASNLLAVLCTSLLPIVVQAPLSFCISVIVLAAADFIIYREKLTKGNVIQLILAAASNLFFAL